MKINILIAIKENLEGKEKEIYSNSLDELITHSKRSICNRVLRKSKYTTLGNDEIKSYVKVINSSARKLNYNITFNEDPVQATEQFIKVIREVVER